MGIRQQSAANTFDLHPEIVGAINESFSVDRLVFLLAASNSELDLVGASACHLIASCPQLKYMRQYETELPGEIERIIRHCTATRSSHFGLSSEQDEEQTNHDDPVEFVIDKLRLDCRNLLTIPISIISPTYAGYILLFYKSNNLESLNCEWVSEANRLAPILAGMIQTIHEKIILKAISLTKRESECLGLLAGGFRPNEIAEKLHISYGSVDKHINSARRRLKAKTRDQAVARAILYNLIG